MNPLTNMRNVTKLSQRELDVNSKVSWHDEYRDSAWIFVGGLPFDLTEGDILAIFSQYGEIVNLNLVRDKATGKSKGFCFVCYENQKSTVLTVDNMNGIKILGRSIRVDHVKDYKPPKDSDKLDDITRMIHAQGVAPETMPELEKTIGDYELLEDEDDKDDYRDNGLGSHSVLKGFKDTYPSIKQERLSPKPTRYDSRNDRSKKEDERNQRDRRDTRDIREDERNQRDRRDTRDIREDDRNQRDRRDPRDIREDDRNQRDRGDTREIRDDDRNQRDRRDTREIGEDDRNQRDRRDTRDIRDDGRSQRDRGDTREIGESKRKHSPSLSPRRERQSRQETDEKEDSKKKHKSHRSKKSKKSKHSKSKKDKKRSKNKKRKASSSENDSSSSESSSDEDSSESESESSDESHRKSKKHRRHKK